MLGVRTQLRGELSLGLDLTERLHFLVFLPRLQVDEQTSECPGSRLATWPTGASDGACSLNMLLCPLWLHNSTHSTFPPMTGLPHMCICGPRRLAR